MHKSTAYMPSVDERCLYRQALRTVEVLVITLGPAKATVSYVVPDQPDRTRVITKPVAYRFLAPLPAKEADHDHLR